MPQVRSFAGVGEIPTYPLRDQGHTGNTMNNYTPPWVDAIRADFPILKRIVDGMHLTYLDSAVTTLNPQIVIDSEQKYSTDYTANIHRGIHLLSEEASAAYEDARRRVARFLNADFCSVVFTKNATESINMVARGLGLQKNDRVLTTISEHHSNILPWMREAKLQLLDRDPMQPLDPASLEEAIKKHPPRILALTHASNVTGVIEPIAELCRSAKKHGVSVLVDASQSVAHFPLDLTDIGCDFLVFSGHKILGPTGVGVLWGQAEALKNLEPLVVGGGMVDRVSLKGYTLKELPYALEAGTPNIVGAIGLAAAINYLDQVGLSMIADYEEQLSDVLENELSEIPGLKLLMARTKPRLALAQLSVVSPVPSVDDLAEILSNTHKIMVRSGFHCAHPFFDHQQLKSGTLRVSACWYNTVEEIKRLGTILKQLIVRFVR